MDGNIIIYGKNRLLFWKILDQNGPALENFRQEQPCLEKFQIKTARPGQRSFTTPFLKTWLLKALNGSIQPAEKFLRQIFCDQSGFFKNSKNTTLLKICILNVGSAFKRSENHSQVPYFLRQDVPIRTLKDFAKSYLEMIKFLKTVNPVYFWLNKIVQFWGKNIP